MNERSRMKKIAIVTGANTGLGFSLVKKLCLLLGDSGIVYLTARDQAKGIAAIKEVNTINGYPAFHLLDVSSDTSIKKFADFIAETHGAVDMFFHNAAARISPTASQREQVQHFIETNNMGTNRIIKAFSPLLRNNSRMVIVASSLGSLLNLDHSLRDKFDTTRQQVEDIDVVMKEYIALVQHDADIINKWPQWMNVTSKIA